MSESKETKPTRNSILFKKWLESTGKSYMDVYKRLNENGITEYNSILSKSGELIEIKTLIILVREIFMVAIMVSAHLQKRILIVQ